MIKCKIYRKKVFLGCIESPTMPIVRTHKAKYTFGDGTISTIETHKSWQIEGNYIGKPLTDLIYEAEIKIITPAGTCTGKALWGMWPGLDLAKPEQPDIVEGSARLTGTGAIKGPPKAIKLLGKG